MWSDSDGTILSSLSGTGHWDSAPTWCFCGVAPESQHPWVPLPALFSFFFSSPSLRSFCHFVPRSPPPPPPPLLLSPWAAVLCSGEGRRERESEGKVKWVKACVWKCQTGDGKIFFLIVNGLLCLSSPFMSSPDLSSSFLPLLLSVPSQDYQRGIFQSIGFKEFHDYLTAPECSTQQEKDALRDKGERKQLWSQLTYLYSAFLHL